MSGSQGTLPRGQLSGVCTVASAFGCEQSCPSRPGGLTWLQEPDRCLSVCATRVLETGGNGNRGCDGVKGDGDLGLVTEGKGTLTHESVFGGDGIYFFITYLKKMYVEFCPSVKLEIRPARGAGFFLPLLQAPSFPKLTPGFLPCAPVGPTRVRRAFEMGVGGSSAQQHLPFPPYSKLCWVSPLETLFSFPPQFGPCRYNWISRFSLSKAGFSALLLHRAEKGREEIDATISKLRCFFFFFF